MTVPTMDPLDEALQSLKFAIQDHDQNHGMIMDALYRVLGQARRVIWTADRIKQESKDGDSRLPDGK
jgi:hypothetical protein